MTNKLILIGFAVAAVGMVALPQTLALFAGQHNFYDTITTNIYNGTGTTTNIPCEKCHGDVATELTQGGAVNAAHNSVGCAGCHMTAPQKEGLNNGPTGQFHAAAAPACLDCHSGAGGGGQDARNILGILVNGVANGTNVEVHAAFANQSGNLTFLKDANEACVGCHTHVAVNISWSKAYMMSFKVAARTLNDGNHSWNISSFATEGSVNVSTYGNQSGTRVNESQPDVSATSLPTGWLDLNHP
jgi:hypothetical protein